MENTLRTIQCKNCGGVMSPDQRTRSFQCAYCGTNRPWPTEGFQDLPVLYRHKPTTRVEGLIKLGHVELMGVPQMPLLDDPLGTAETLRRWDLRTAAIGGSMEGELFLPRLRWSGAGAFYTKHFSVRILRQ